MSNFKHLISGFTTDLDTNGVHVIGKKKYDFKRITEEQCNYIIKKGSKHVQATAPNADSNEVKKTSEKKA